MSKNSDDYAKEYDEQKFWDKTKKFAKTIGRPVIEEIFTLYYCLKDPDTPMQAKGIIIGALGYFILPLDAIPDFIPGVGFADDIGALAVAMNAIKDHVTEEHRQKAREQVEKLFREGDGD